MGLSSFFFFGVFHLFTFGPQKMPFRFLLLHRSEIRNNCGKHHHHRHRKSERRDPAAESIGIRQEEAARSDPPTQPATRRADVELGNGGRRGHVVARAGQDLALHLRRHRDRRRHRRLRPRRRLVRLPDVHLYRARGSAVAFDLVRLCPWLRRVLCVRCFWSHSTRE